ncbi:MAG TPA: sigma-70 family RNA polymerase sigma factor [Thermoanaerobaculia bacterium]|jgi:RNA polymerase sigma factor for flagellar operon FliA|nr:sigma-70 family RNA polymerase sigma factor [Thermoanaerobaculia bacterium]
MATLPSSPDGLPPDQFFLGHLKLIEEVISHACRRSHLSREDAEDFAGQVHCKLIEDNYAVLRKFQGRSSPKTYLTVVINNQLLDFQDSKWGKFRASAEALRLGPIAIRLERLLVRDGYTFTEACGILQTNEKVEASVAELAELRARLPPRTGRYPPAGEEQLKSKPDTAPRPDEQVEEKEKEKTRRRVYMAQNRALMTLPKEDRLLVRMRMEFSVAQISRIRGIEQKPLYRRLEKIYKELRKAIEREGVRRQDVEELLASMAPEIWDF